MNFRNIFLLFVIASSGCTFIDIDAPKNQMLTTNVFGNDETATASMIDIYLGMVGRKSDNFSIALACGYSADEFFNHTSYIPLSEIYVNNLKPTDAYTNRFWTNSYFYIYQANAVIEGCEHSTALHPEVKKQLLAEAHFIRAFWLYYLNSFFGDIPLTVNTDYEANLNLERSPFSEVYAQMVSDLEYAINNLNSLYVNGTSVITVNDRIRPNQASAQALLARVYLTAKEWKLAEQMASAVISNKTLYDTVSVNDVFLVNNKESIWQIAMPTPRPTNVSTPEASGFVLQNKPLSASASECATVSKNLLDAFEPGDLRRQHWIGAFTDVTVTPNQSYLYPNKYKVRITTATPTEQSTVLRLAEQYLIRAEARVHLSDFDGALADINLIRKRAGLPALSSGNQDYMLRAILKERQTEFFAEWGHRWIDLKRMGFASEIMPEVLEGKQGGAWSSTMELWPIPQTEVDRNSNLKQNAGYN